MINGLMQIGIGVSDIDEAYDWYSKVLGYSIVVFDDTAEASLMVPHTGGKVYKRRALFLMNPLGGAGIELWQFIDKKPEPFRSVSTQRNQGLNTILIRCRSLEITSEFFHNNYPLLVEENQFLGSLLVRDAYGNLLKIVEKEYFLRTDLTFGGICGVMIGARNPSRLIELLVLLGYSLTADATETSCLEIPVGKTHFGKLYGPSSIEIIKVDDNSISLYGNRLWGDPGFIHLCFDLKNTDEAKVILEKAGFPFTVDSGSSFAMGSSSGRFSYIEPELNLLVEFIELHTVPDFL